jgi:hypothetical protein
VYFGPSYPPPFVANTTGISYDPGTLGGSPKYYWQVVARNAAGTTGSGLFSFTTLPVLGLSLAQQGGKLVDTSAVNLPDQGRSVALSADGNTALVGGGVLAGEVSDAGAAWVYTRSGGVWTPQGGKLVASDAVGNAYQGSSVSLSADGSTALVGGFFDNNGVGAAWVYTRSGGVWTQQGAKLLGSGGSAAGGQGWSVALSADGNTALVGGRYDNNGAGAVWVYTRSGSVWTQQGGKLVAPGAVGGAQLGASVALSADGNTALVGGPTDNCDGGSSGCPGAAWVYTRSGGVWTQQGSKLVATDSAGNAQQGSSVALSADGNTAVVGGPWDSDFAGAAWVFTRSGGVWTQQGAKLVGSDALGNAFQGSSVALSADGNTAVVGGPCDTSGCPNAGIGPGAIWFFARSEGAWTQQGEVVGAGAAGNAGQGWSVALSGDGNTAVVGGPLDNSGFGAAWVFTVVPGGPGVTTSPAISITPSSATLPGSVNPNGSDTQVWFLYSSNRSMFGALATTTQDIGSGTVAAPVSANITGLALGASYYYQAMAQNSAGTVQGSILSFTTVTGPPSVSTSAAISVAGGTAGLAGVVNPNGLDTQVWFLYATNSSMSGAVSTPQQDIGPGTAPVPVNANVTGFGANATYYFQAVAQNSAGTTQGAILSFTATSLDQYPTVGTYPATSIASSSATLAGVVNPAGSDTLVWFVYSTNSSMSDALSTPPQDVGSGTVPVPFTANITDLAANVPYYFQAVAQNGAGTAQGSAVGFITRAHSPVAFGQQGGKLVGTGAVGGAWQGTAVALSADGNTAIVGGWQDNNGAGAVWMYTRAGGVWTQQGGKLVGTGAAGNAEQGYSVALSADGNTAIVGGPSDNSGAGAVWVFTRSGGVWTQQGSKLVGTGAVQYGPSVGVGQGSSVALSADGNTAIVGGPGDNRDVAWIYDPVGAVWVFTRSGGVWTQQGGKLVGGFLQDQGSSVGLSADGNTAIVGAPGTGGYDWNTTGAVVVYTRSEGVWNQQGGKLIGTGAAGDAGQGYSVALSADGNTAIVGGPTDNCGAYGANCAGAAWVYTRSEGVWTQQGSKLIEGGDSVALSADGNTAILGGGAVHTRSGGVWTQQGGSLGSPVALSADGRTAIAGISDDNNGVGAAQIFTSPPPAKIGTYNAGQWYLDANGNGTFDGAPPDVSGNFGTGMPGAVPVIGDWNGSGRQKMGVFYQGVWYLDFIGNGTWDGGVIDKQYSFGWNDPNVIPVVGDWNGDGRTKIGIYYQGSWYLDYDGNGVWDGGVNDKAYSFGWAATGVTPMVGDWSGSGTAKIGIYYNGVWYLDYDGNGVWDGGVNDKQYNFGWATTGVTPIIGDWNGDGRTKIGVYYQGSWYLDYDGNGAWDYGVQDKAYNFGWSGATPVVGDWSGSGTAKIGVFYNGYWYLDYIGNGVWDGGAIDKAYVWGGAGDTPVVGRW